MCLPFMVALRVVVPSSLELPVRRETTWFPSFPSIPIESPCTGFSLLALLLPGFLVLDALSVVILGRKDLMTGVTGNFFDYENSLLSLRITEVR